MTQRTREQNIEIIREACIAANPEIVALPSFPEDSDARRAILALERMIGRNHENRDFSETARLYVRAYEEERRTAYVRELEGKYPARRPIRLADVLLAISANTYDAGYGDTVLNLLGIDCCVSCHTRGAASQQLWNLRADDITLQSNKTLTFLADLLAPTQDEGGEIRDGV